MTEVPPSNTALQPSRTEDEKLIQDETKLDGWEESEIQQYNNKKSGERFATNIYHRQCHIILGIMRENARQQNWTATQIEEAEQEILQANTDRHHTMCKPNKCQRNV